MFSTVLSDTLSIPTQNFSPRASQIRLVLLNLYDGIKITQLYKLFLVGKIINLSFAYVESFYSYDGKFLPHTCKIHVDNVNMHDNYK